MPTGLRSSIISDITSTAMPIKTAIKGKWDLPWAFSKEFEIETIEIKNTATASIAKQFAAASKGKRVLPSAIIKGVDHLAAPYIKDIQLLPATKRNTPQGIAIIAEIRRACLVKNPALLLRFTANAAETVGRMLIPSGNTRVEGNRS